MLSIQFSHKGPTKIVDKGLTYLLTWSFNKSMNNQWEKYLLQGNS